MFVYGSTEIDPDVSIDRTSRLISNFIANKNLVINGYFRKDRNPMNESKIKSGMMNLPIDFINSNIERLSEMNFDGKEKFFSFLIRPQHLFGKYISLLPKIGLLYQI